MNWITSRNNPHIKAARALRTRKARQQSQQFLVEGIHHVGEAVEAGAAVRAIFYAPELLDSAYAQELVASQAALGTPCYATTAQVFTSLAGKENPQGIVAIIQQAELVLEAFTPANFAWGVALVKPQDPGNIGTILRTIDAVDASGLLLLDGGADPYHPNALRASMGTIFWHPMVQASFGEFAEWARQNAYHIYGTSAHADCDHREVEDYNQPCILLMGSEREGLSADQSAICEKLIRLPMHGRTTSLNLAVATGVMLYDMLNIFSPANDAL